MSTAKFAPLTSSLLARKGYAAPWTPPDRGQNAPVWESPLARDERDDLPPIVAHPSVHLGEERPRKSTVTLSAREYEKLGIIAVKKDVTRQQVIREAIETYLETAARDYQTECGCLAKGACGRAECAA